MLRLVMEPVIVNDPFETIEKGQRLDRQQALWMLAKAPLGRLMEAAHLLRVKRHGDRLVTFVFDTNPNYTNICNTGCKFCAFCRPAGADDAYILSPSQLAAKVKAAYEAGATTVLLQGGHNPQVTLKDWIAFIRAIRKTCPDIHIHPFSPAEYVFMSQNEAVDLEKVLRIIWDEGVRTIPGGGAEILSETVRRKIAPAKASVSQWLEACRIAHKIGFRTTATMMYGHVEKDDDIVEHLMLLRGLQDETGGFTSFIPWSFKPGQTALARRVKHPAHPAKYVRIIALARIVLDNFEHIQSSWFSENVAAGQLGLLAGADDFGGILVEENVLQQAGHNPKATLDKVKTIIRRAGFTPAQRDSDYKIMEIFQAPDPPGIGGVASNAD